MQKRLLKELKQFKENPTPNIFIEDTDDLRLWRVNLIGTENSLYAGEKFMLQFVFPNDYPMEAPEVIFVQNPAKNIIIPKHPHIYSNGKQAHKRVILLYTRRHHLLHHHYPHSPLTPKTT
eukprot:GEZU01012620.1.p1 GENE.GEZU01012620.1~~GEZU01012620.1.p1  ORF type:complete len:120 (-),score=13.10 GEZU01012620.1:50-409(-)